MPRRRPLTPQQPAEIREAAKRRPDGKPLAETMREMVDGTANGACLGIASIAAPANG